VPSPNDHHDPATAGPGPSRQAGNGSCLRPSHREVPTEATLDLLSTLSSVQETAYLWDVAAGRIEWERNAAEVLGMRTIGELVTAENFHTHIAPEHVQRRHDAIARAPAESGSDGARYRVQYRFTPQGHRNDASLWLEDHGRAWFDGTGHLVRARGVIRVINDRYIEEQELLHRSDHDELTGQLNRARLLDALGTVITRSRHFGRRCAFLMIAIDNLAVTNETFGFDVGDELIGDTARVIRSRLRSGDTMGRYSSNKFGIILNECGPGSMRVAAERFIKAVREATIETSACPLSASVSVGAVMLPDHADTTHEAISRSLDALDRARRGRSDGFASFEKSLMRESVRRRNITIADEVIAALSERRMLIVLQPIVSMKTRKPDLYECLLRMERADGTLVRAGEFIPVAEQLGLSRLIDRRTLELAIDVLVKFPEIRLSLNVSGLTVSDHEWLVALHKLTGGRRSITERLVVEITETAAIHDLDLSINFVDTLKEIGCKVAIDDFGAGYTSFKNLKMLNVDMVKIDGIFVENLLEEPTNRVFIKALAEIAQTFGLDTVAEWVGDEETARICAECGISHMQGFLFGQPMLASELDQAPDAETACAS